jgi:hypothetical protein
MKARYPKLALIWCTTALVAACTAEATPPPVDAVATVAVQLAHQMQTQTAAAHSPTSPPATVTSIPTETSTPEPVKDPTKNIITVVNYTGCYHGPGPDYPLQSHINVPKDVELLGIGSVEGWYVISGPYYYSACWVSAADVQIDADVDLTRFPVMTPGR